MQRPCYARTCVDMERSSAVPATNYRVDAGYRFRTLSTVFHHREAPTRRLPTVLSNQAGEVQMMQSFAVIASFVFQQMSLQMKKSAWGVVFVEL